jgi:MFS family permease
MRGVDSLAAMLIGCLFLLAGAAVTLAAILTQRPAAFLCGSAIAGVGFGVAFLAALRRITALAEPDQRAALLAAVFSVSYLAFSVPALLAGVATTRFGLHATALVYCASLGLLSAVAVALMPLSAAPPHPNVKQYASAPGASNTIRSVRSRTPSRTRTS